MEGAADICGVEDGRYLDEGHDGWGFERGSFGGRVGCFMNYDNT